MREHFFCHQLLTKIYPYPEMFKALSIFCKLKQGQRQLTSRQYQICREAARQANILWWSVEENKQKMMISNKEGARKRKLYIKNHPDCLSTLRASVSDRASHSRWFNNGEIEKFCIECPEGFKLGRLKINDAKRQAITEMMNKSRQNKSDEDKEKEFKNRSNASKTKHQKGQCKYIKGNHWYNDGKINVKSFDCPPGFKEGKLIYKETKKVICIETGEIFNSKDLPGVHKVCNGYRKTYKGLHYKWFNNNVDKEAQVYENISNT